ncbi:MAG: hypothetical protein ACP5FH_10685, partial [Terracidiphilus sp.]
AARIVNPASQKQALNVINAVATILNTILALVTTISSKAAVQQMVIESHIKISQVRPYLNRKQAVAMVAAHYGEPVEVAQLQLARAQSDAVQAGF